MCIGFELTCVDAYAYEEVTVDAPINSEDEKYIGEGVFHKMVEK